MIKNYVYIGQNPTALTDVVFSSPNGAWHVLSFMDEFIGV
jgi:hypothetical protein